MAAGLRLHRGQQMVSLEQQVGGRRLADERIRSQLATTPVDEDHAEALLWDAYAAAGLTPLRHIHWLDGPLEQIAALGHDDEAGRLHNTLGPAIQFPDGWGFWAQYGVHVPSWIVERPAEELTHDDFFAAPNSEVRRVIQERMGERFLWETGARFVESGPRGILYEVTLPVEDERVARYVQVRDASTERIYYLRVPPTIPTAEAAVAWTFGLSVDEYDPAQET